MSKTILTLGDSITAGASSITSKYAKTLAEKLGYKLINKGVSGSTIKTNCNDIKTVDLTNVDIVTIMTGTNGTGTALGTIDDVKDDFNNNGTTFYGYLGFIADYARYMNPLLKVYFITPPQSGTPTGTAMQSILTAFKKVGEKCSVPVIDVYGESGLLYHNEKVRKFYYADIAHPTQLGHDNIADFIFNKIKSMQTI